MPLATRRAIPVLLAAFLAVEVGMFAAPAAVRAWSSDSFSSADEDRMVQLVNRERASRGLAPLAVSGDLHDLARWRSKDMAVRDYFSHLIPTECYGVDHYLTEAGIDYAWWAANSQWNLASDTDATQVAFDWFMGSAVHRGNILEPEAREIGVGAYKATWTYGSACDSTGSGKTYSGTHIYTLLFIEPKSTATPKPTATPTPKATPKPTPTPTPTPTPKPAQKPTPKPTPTPTPTSTATPAPEVGGSGGATATPEPSAPAPAEGGGVGGGVAAPSLSPDPALYPSTSATPHATATALLPGSAPGGASGSASPGLANAPGRSEPPAGSAENLSMTTTRQQVAIALALSASGGPPFLLLLLLFARWRRRNGVRH